MDLSFLLALEVGEHYTFDIKPTASESINNTPRSAWLSYRRIGNELNNLRESHKNMEFAQRAGDWKNKATRYKVFVYCTRKGDKRMDPPPPKNGFVKFIEQAAKRDKAAKALQQELDAPPPVPPATHTPPHVRTITVDDQKRLVEMVQAAARGETIQLLNVSTEQWADLKPEHINWAVPINRMRIKPKPRRTVYLNNDTFKHTFDHDEAKKWASGYTPFREVFPEDEE